MCKGRDVIEVFQTVDQPTAEVLRGLVSTGSSKVLRKNINIERPTEQMYVAMAVTLDNTPQVRSLIDHIQAFYLSSWRLAWELDDLQPRRFFAIIAPSGSGKTQMGFTLASLKDSLDVVHIALSSNGGTQPIYRCDIIAGPTERCMEAVDADIERVGSVSALQLLEDANQHQTLRTVVWLSAHFSLHEPGMPPMSTVRQLRKALWDRIAERTLPVPVIVVDEACCEATTFAVTLRSLLRSILRAVGIASIFLGRSIDVVRNGGGHSVGSRGGQLESSDEWATFVPNLPCTHLSEHNSLSQRNDLTALGLSGTDLKR
jgi:hypothetical protein